jgi:predicted enzyme related to lactoylglutathione lyase
LINYRVENLNALLAKLRSQGVRQVGDVEQYWYGRFAWVIDAEGNRVELWEPDHYSPSEFHRQMMSKR